MAGFEGSAVTYDIPGNNRQPQIAVFSFSDSLSPGTGEEWEGKGELQAFQAQVLALDFIKEQKMGSWVLTLPVLCTDTCGRCYPREKYCSGGMAPTVWTFATLWLSDKHHHVPFSTAQVEE